MNNETACNTSSTIDREFNDATIFNTLTCNRICIPLNFFLPKPLKFKKLYHRKVYNKNKSELSLPKNNFFFTQLYSIPHSSRHKESTEICCENDSKKTGKEFLKDITSKKTCRTECKMGK